MYQVSLIAATATVAAAAVDGIVVTIAIVGGQNTQRAGGQGGVLIIPFIIAFSFFG